jgi:hypothetical protein
VRDDSLRDLAPLAALGLLDGEEADAFAEAAARSPECQRDLEAFERVVGLISLAGGRASRDVDRK